MSDQLARSAHRRGAVPAFVTAAAILAALIVLDILSTVLTSVRIAMTREFGYLGDVWWGLFGTSLLGAVPFAIGVFLAFWRVVPIAGSLPFVHVVTRALLAGLIGAGAYWVLSLVVQFAIAFVSAGWTGDIGARLAHVSPVDLLFGAGHLLLNAIPLVVLGAVLLWGRLQRHPADAAPLETLDEA